MKAKTFLSRAYRLDLKINIKLEQIEHLRSLAYRVTSSIREDKVSRDGQPKGLLEDTVIKLVMAEQALNREIDRFIDTRDEISGLVQLVADDDERILLELRYLCFHTWEQIAQKMSISCSYAYQLHRRALESFEYVLTSRGRRGNE